MKTSQKIFSFLLCLALVLGTLFSFSGCNNTSNLSSSNSLASEKSSLPADTASKPAETASKPTESTTPSSETVSQANALKKAKSYLNLTAFSHDGLVAQLEFDKFSHEDAVYAADKCGADWKEQAAKKAKSYLKISAFSRDKLIEQLVFDKFTDEQAQYGASANGL